MRLSVYDTHIKIKGAPVLVRSQFPSPLGDPASLAGILVIEACRTSCCNNIQCCFKLVNLLTLTILNSKNVDFVCKLQNIAGTMLQLEQFTVRECG